jgi:transcriptional regulator GlxA family with amidase domain
MAAPRRVVFVLYDEVQSLDLTGPWEVFSAAEARRAGSYELTAAAVAAGPVRSSSGLTITAPERLAAVAHADTLIVPGGTGTRAAASDPRLLSEVERLAAVARRTAAVCSGSFVLGAAGLLEGRRAVTHWAYCELLARTFPGADVESDPIFVRDGSVFTSAGVTAGIDLALALVEDDLGPEVALDVARWLVVYARRPGGQAQFSVQLANRAATSDPLRELQAWIAENPDADLSVAGLASRMHLSERQLARRFRAELGSSPADYVEQQRVEIARGRLEDGDEDLEAVATATGFGSAEVMRRAFQRRIGTSPRSYRERFGVRARAPG